MKKVVVTGLGIVSSIGNNKLEVLESLKNGKSGIEYCPEYAELEFRSHVNGSINIDLETFIDRYFVSDEYIRLRKITLPYFRILHTI